MPKGVAKKARTKKMPDPVDSYVGEQIRRFRLAKGKSQSKIADALGLTFQQVQKYEKGANRIAPGRLAKLADLFGISVSEFFPAKYVSNLALLDDDPMRKLGQTRNGMKLARAFLLVDNDGAQSAIIGVVEAFAAERRAERR
jgi:transcriptional regulator with XRE-family HTH domain